MGKDETDAEIVRCILNGEPSPKRHKKKRRRQSSPRHDHATIVHDVHTTLHKFKQCRHSLRLSASRIAAMSGFHPYAHLPQLLMDLIYQGPIGQKLLRHDAKLLRIELTSKDEMLQQIASKAGKRVKNVLLKSMDVSNGKIQLDTLRQVRQFQTDATAKVDGDARGVLTDGELKLLQEGMRHNVHTGYGKVHEEHALDAYEKMCGWEVTCRNECLKCWEFVEAGIDVVNGNYHNGDEDEDGNDGTNGVSVDVIPTVKPRGRAEELVRHLSKDDKDNDEKGDSSHSTAKVVEDQKGLTASEPIEIDSSQEMDPGQNAMTEKEEKKVEGGEISSKCSTHEPPRSSFKGGTSKKKPFFTIVGVADGIREELWNHPKHDSAVKEMEQQETLKGQDDSGSIRNGHKYDDDQDWSVRKIVVECKHRMRSAINPPPLYDQIQAVVYCFMYGTTEGEIIQVVRDVLSKEQEEEQEEKKAEKSDNDNGKHERLDLGCRDNAKMEVDGNTKADGTHCGMASGTNNGLTITVDGSSTLDEPKTGMVAENITAGNPSGIIVDGSASDENDIIDEEGQEDCKVLTTQEKGYTETTKPPTRARSKLDESLKPNTNPKEEPTIHITCNRVSLDEPIMQHRHNWHNIILPRLRSFVDAVYSIRQCDDKRYRMIQAATVASSGASDGEDAWWQILMNECPWLMDCDIAFSRR